MTLYRLLDEKQGEDWVPIGTVFHDGPRLCCYLADSSVFHDLGPAFLDELAAERLPLGPGEFRLGPMSAVDLPHPEDEAVAPELAAQGHLALLARVRRDERQRVPVRRKGDETVVGFVEVSARGEVMCQGPTDLEEAVAAAPEGVWIVRDVCEDNGSQGAVPVILTPDHFMFVEWLSAHQLWPHGYEAACPMPWM